MSEPPRPPMGYNPYGGDSGQYPQQQPPQTAQWQGQTGQWQSPAPTKKKKSKLVPLLVGAMVLAAVATGGGLYLTGAFSTEIRTETVAFEDPNAFTTPVGQGQVLPVANTTGTAPPAPTGTVSGASTALYGGTGDDKSCDKAQLLAFLEQDPAKAAAWAQVQGIQVAQIRDYIATLTPVLLRSDTAVTNHGFRNGTANPINAVLQAGTAVLVDNRGIPRARCFCGNPLAEGKQFSRTKLSGTQWQGFDQNKVTRVTPSSQPIQQFTLVNVITNTTYSQVVDNSVNVGGNLTNNTGTGTGTGTPQSGTQTTTRAPGASRTTTTTRAPGQQQQQQAPAQQQQAPASQQSGGGATCEYTDAGDGSPITAKEGSSFTDSRGERYRVGSGCNLIPA
jgi:hypothetical protein